MLMAESCSCLLKCCRWLPAQPGPAVFVAFIIKDEPGSQDLVQEAHVLVHDVTVGGGTSLTGSSPGSRRGPGDHQSQGGGSH